jgi:basic amino acid/polyamine antiporter, APA family
MAGDKPQNAQLIRGLNLLDATTIVVGCIIGAGIFRLSGRVAAFSPSPFMFLLAWVLGGLLSLCGALCYAELATLYPKTGGDYVFLTQAYGRFWGFVFGWTKLFVQRTGTIAIVAFIFAEHACRTFGWELGQAKPLAMAAIALLTAANIIGLGLGKNIQNLFTGLKVLALLLIVAAGLLFQKGSAQNFQPFWPEWSWSLMSSTGVALIFVLWTYGGWTEAAYVAEEVRDPGRNLPRAIVGGLLATTALYLLVNTVYLYYLPLEEMRQTKLVAAEAMDKIWRGRGGQIVSAMVMVSTLGALNGFVLTGGRILYALAKDHALFRRLARVSPKTHTPVLSLLFNAGIAMILVWTGTLDQIVTYTEIVIYLFFGMTGVSLFVFRKKYPEAPRAYKVWAYPVVPAIFVLMCFAFAANATWEQPKESLFGIVVAAIGIPLYFLSERLTRSQKPA